MGESGGGPPRSVGQLCDHLVGQVPVHLLTSEDPQDPLVPLRQEVQTHFVSGENRTMLGRLQAAGFSSSLEGIHQVHPLSLCHQHGVWLRCSHETTRFAHSQGIPLVVAPRGMLEPWAINNSKWKKKIAWALYQKRDLQKATAFHATARSEADSIRRLGFKQPIAIIPNGIVLPDDSVRCSSFLVPGSSSSNDGSSFFVPRSSFKGGSESENKEQSTNNQEQREAPQERRTKNEEQRTERTALFLSRINPKKGLPMLLDAWAKLAPVDWRLVIAGNDDSNHLPVVERKIRELGLQGQVTIAGPLFGEAKEAAYRNADLFVLPSYSENFGIVVTEALGYQVPVLTTTGCPWQELVTERCGWWVEPTPGGIHAGLTQALATSDVDLAEMGVRGRQLVEAKYQWPGIADRMFEFYEWILHGGPQPDFVV